MTVPFLEPIAELKEGSHTYCVQFVSGRAACWGRNMFSNYAPTLDESATPLRIDR